MAGSQATPKRTGGPGAANDFASSFVSSSPLAQEVVARDVAACFDDDADEDDAAVDMSSDDDEDVDVATAPTLYRRPSGVAFGTTRPALLAPHVLEEPILTHRERHRSRDAERSLLRDNHILPPKHGLHHDVGFLASLSRRLFSTKVWRPEPDEESLAQGSCLPTESSPLLRQGPSPQGLNEQWDAAVAAGQIKTTWQREAKTLAIYSRSLILTFLLQYSINVASVFAVGRIGSLELGAVTLATMTANITCYAPFQGLATSLDTLCAQAYGSGHRHLVGLQFQRMSCFLLMLVVPIAVLWSFSEPILGRLVPDPRSAALAAQYLHVILLGMPAFVLFEGGKRFVQAQGLFHATTYVLLVAAPLNVLLNWLLVWKLGWGFVGAPVAVVVTQNLLPVLLFLYVWRVDGSQCWGGFSKRALTNWGTMVRLAIPGMIMVTAEWFAFEVLTVASGQLGTSYLAAQSVLVTLSSTTFQIPFPLSIAGSTRVANLIGAQLVGAAKTSAKVCVVAGGMIGFFNLAVVWGFRYQIPTLFTQDAEVAEIVAHVIPVVAIMQVFDGLATVAHGILRGLGRQAIGGYTNLGSYYLIALPTSFGTCFGLGWGLKGLWFGATVGLLVVSCVEYWFICRSDWERSAKEAENRNAIG